MSLCWYALQSKPNRESFLNSQLSHRQIETYFPCLRVSPVNPRARKMKPYFPGYLFVRLDLGQTPVSSLAWVPGANRLVSFDDLPASVPDEAIDAIRKNVDQINNQSRNPKPALQHGDPVEILDGPFKGYQAIFDAAIEGSERVRLLVKLLRDKHLRVQLPARLAEPKKSKH